VVGFALAIASGTDLKKSDFLKKSDLYLVVHQIVTVNSDGLDSSLL